MKKSDLELHQVLLCRVYENTYSLLGHNLSASEAEELLDELHEQGLPACRGRQTGEHADAGRVEDCPRCQRAAEMILQTQRAVFERNLKQEQEQEPLDCTGPEYLQRLRRALRALPEVVPCRRCGELMRRQESNREKRPHGSDGDGDLFPACPACLVTRFLLSGPDLTTCLRAAMAQQGRHILFQRDFQKVIGAFFLAAAAEDSDFPLEEIDWRKVRDRWDLA